MSIASFEAIPTDAIYAKLNDVEPEALTPRFDTIGLEHFLLLDNFGTLGFVIALIPFLYFLHWLISKFRGIKCCRKWDKSLDNSLYYGFLLRTIIESYIIGVLCCLINLNMQDYSLDSLSSSKWTFGNSVLACIFIPIFIAFPFWAVYFMYSNW